MQINRGARERRVVHKELDPPGAVQSQEQQKVDDKVGSKPVVQSYPPQPVGRHCPKPQAPRQDAPVGADHEYAVLVRQVPYPLFLGGHHRHFVVAAGCDVLVQQVVVHLLVPVGHDQARFGFVRVQKFVVPRGQDPMQFRGQCVQPVFRKCHDSENQTFADKYRHPKGLLPATVNHVQTEMHEEKNWYVVYGERMPKY